MCDPGSTGGFALASGTTALQGAGVFNGGIGAYFASLGQKNAMKTSANIADINARMAEDSAQSALLAGQREEQNIDIRTTNTLGAEKASYGASGVDVNGGGSVGAVMSTTQIMGESDAITAKANAVRTAWGFRTQAVSDKNQALADRATADGISPGMAASGSLLTGASSVASSYYNLKKQGYFNVKDTGST